MFISFLGWLSAFCFMASAASQAYKCHKQGHGHGLSYKFLILWGVAESSRMLYIIIKLGLVWPILVNHMVDLTCLLIIVRYRIFPREK